MPGALQRLHQDHVNLLRLMAVLERQLGFFDSGTRPDWDIVQGVIDYLLTYPDLRHHPLEDRILKRIQIRHPAAAQPFAGLEAEHRELAAALRRIAAATAQLLQDAAMAREGYSHLLRDFLAQQRRHLRLEEAGLFPLAEQLLDENDWQEVGSQTPGLADPLGDPADHRFQVLRWQLAHWEAADRETRANEEARPGTGRPPRP